MSYSEETLAELGALFMAAEESALDAHTLLHPPGGVAPVDDVHRASLAQAHALTSFALVAAMQARIALVQMQQETAPPTEPA